MIDQGRNVLDPDQPGPGRFKDGDIPDSAYPDDDAYASMPPGGFGMPGRDSTGKQALPKGVTIDGGAAAPAAAGTGTGTGGAAGGASPDEPDAPAEDVDLS